MKQPEIKIDAGLWTGLWAMEAQTLRSLAANSMKATQDQTPQEAPSYGINGTTAIIPIVGPIAKYPSMLQAVFGGVSTMEVQSYIDKALYDDSVTQIVLYIDSPGGMVAGTSDLAEAIAAAKTLKPITAYISDHCFSAAYWLASQCTRIVANEGAFIGSIGVYSVLTDSSKAAASAGFELTLVSAGEFKGLEEPGIPVDQKAVGETYRQVTSVYNLFTSAIQKGRNMPANVVKQLADGRVHVASEAKAMKLIDAIGPLGAAIAFNQDQSDMDTNNSKTKADGGDEEASASATDVELIKQVLAAIAALSDKISKAEAEDELEDDEEVDDQGEPSKEDDDEEKDKSMIKGSKAVKAERARCKAIQEACGGRAEFALKAFMEGKSPLEAKASLADVLNIENVNLRKKTDATEGVEPLALASNDTNDPTDPEVIWKQNIGGVQKAYSGKKEYYLAAMKHNNKKLNKGASL